MALTTHSIPSPSILDIIYDGKVNVGQALHDIDGFWKYRPSGSGWIEAHNLRQIADLLDGLNAPYKKELADYFDSLSKEISQVPQDDFLPF